MSKTKLIISALTKYIAGLLMVGLMLFLPAGTLHYFNGWLFIALLFIPMLLLGVVLVSYGLYAEVMRENIYLSRTVEVQEEQKVIDTGLYAVVRHPMYFSTVLLFLSIPVVLGSWIGFAIFCVYPFLLVKRIRNEEMVLEEGLAGYKEYKEKVRCRMIPFVW